MKTPRFLASTLTLACLMAMQTTAHAAVDPTVIPLNSQIGSLRLPYQCTFPIIGTQTLVIKLTGSMATTVTPGQTFYMTDGSGTLEFPQSLVDLSYSLLGARSGSGTITELNFDIAKASPATVNALSVPIVVDNLPFSKGTPVKMAIPASGFLQVGPMVAQNSEGQVLVKMGTAKGVLRLKSASGKTILFDLGVNCKAPSPAVIALGMTIAGTHSNEVSAPHTNIRTEDLDTPMNTQTGSLRFPLSCNVQGLGRREVDGTFNGVAPVLYAPGQVFNAGTGYGRIVLPAGVVGELMDQVPAATKASTYVDLLEFSATNTSPAMVSMATKPIVGSDIALVRGQDAVTRFPAATDLAIGPFKALSTGTDTALYVGRTGAVVQLKNNAGQLLDARRVDCDTPNPPTTIVSVTIGGAAAIPAKLSSVTPSTGAPAGGKTVYIMGSGFKGATGVSFGGVPATSYRVVNNTMITAVTPALTAGVVNVSVEAPAGSANTVPYTVK